MKIKDSYVLKRVADTNIVVPIGSGDIDFNTVITLNDSGAFLWDELKKGSSLEALTEAMTNRYEVTEEKAKADITAFLDKARKAGLLDE